MADEEHSACVVKESGPEIKQACPNCDTEITLVKCSHCHLNICTKCRASHTTDMKRDLKSTIRDLKIKAENTKKNEIGVESRRILAGNFTAMRQSVTESVDHLCSLLKKRQEQMLRELFTYEIEEEQGIESGDKALDAKMETIDNFYNENIDKIQSINSQTDMVQLQKRCSSFDKELQSLEADILKTNEVTLDLDTEGMARLIKDFGKIDRNNTKTLFYIGANEASAASVNTLEFK